MIKLGSIVTDNVTALMGMVTHLSIELNRNRQYWFQSRGLNPETGQPLSGFWTVEERLEGGEEMEEPNLPLNVLGTEVEDMASGFKGPAIGVVLHISGCVHVDVQPKGTTSKTGDRIKAANFDIRRLSGAAIKPMTEAERRKSRKEAPSPSPVDCCEREAPEY